MPPPPPSRPAHRPARALPTELSVSNDTVPDDACAVLAFPASTPSTRSHQSAVPTPHHTTHHHSRSTAEQQRELWPATAAVDQDVRFLTAAPAIRDPFGFPHHLPGPPSQSTPLLTAHCSPGTTTTQQPQTAPCILIQGCGIQIDREAQAAFCAQQQQQQQQPHQPAITLSS
jgi:hypothetical protein